MTRSTTHVTAACTAALLLLCAAPAGAAPQPASQSRSAASCRASTSPDAIQTRVARYRLDHAIVSRGTNPKTGEPLEPNPRERSTPLYGVVTVQAQTCRSGKRWTVLPLVNISVDSNGVDGQGAPKGDSPDLRGWGVAVSRIDTRKRPQFRVNVLYCKGGGPFATLKVLNSIPVPGLKYPVSAAKFVLGQFLPKDSANCANAGDTTLRLSASRKGKLRLRHSGRLKGEEEQLGGYGGANVYRTWQPRKPQIR